MLIVLLQVGHTYGRRILTILRSRGYNLGERVVRPQSLAKQLHFIRHKGDGTRKDFEIRLHILQHGHKIHVVQNEKLADKMESYDLSMMCTRSSVVGAGVPWLKSNIYGWGGI